MGGVTLEALPYYRSLHRGNQASRPGQNRQRLWTLSAWYARRQVELTGVGTVGTPIARPVFAFDLRLQKEGHQFSVDEQGAVVADQAHPSEPIHKETHSRTGRADHLRKSLLAYLEDSGP